MAWWIHVRTGAGEWICMRNEDIRNYAVRPRFHAGWILYSHYMKPQASGKVEIRTVARSSFREHINWRYGSNSAVQLGVINSFLQLKIAIIHLRSLCQEDIAITKITRTANVTNLSS